MTGLHEAGVPAVQVKAVLPNAKFLGVDGVLEGEELVAAFIMEYPGAEKNQRRWWFDTPLHDDGRTWVLSKMWGLDTEPTLQALVALSPEGQTFGFEAS